MATATRIGELQALSFSVSYRGDDLVFHYGPFFLAKIEAVSHPLPRSVIVQSLTDFVGDLPERVLCPVRAIHYLRRAVRSVEFTPSTLFVSPSGSTWHRKMLFSSLDNESLRAGLCHLRFHKEPMTSKGLLLLWIIIQFFPSLPSKRQFHGSLTECLPWDTLKTCLPPDQGSEVWAPDRRWFCCSSALINGSLCHVYVSPCTIMATWAYIGKVPTKNLFISGIFTIWAISLQIPSYPCPTLTF